MIALLLLYKKVLKHFIFISTTTTTESVECKNLKTNGVLYE